MGSNDPEILQKSFLVEENDFDICFLIQKTATFFIMFMYKYKSLMKTIRYSSCESDILSLTIFYLIQDFIDESDILTTKH